MHGGRWVESRGHRDRSLPTAHGNLGAWPAIGTGVTVGVSAGPRQSLGKTFSPPMAAAPSADVMSAPTNGSCG